MGRLIGYVRTSTLEQNNALQIRALDEEGCDEIFADKASGADRDRPQLERALEACQPGDTFVFWKVDRVGRSSSHVISIFEDLTKRGVKIRSITEPLDTSTPMGEAFIGILAVFAQMERKIAAERRQAGIEAAKAEGKHLGRPPVQTPEKLEAALKLLESGMLMKDIAAALGMSSSTLKRMLGGEEITKLVKILKPGQRVRPGRPKKILAAIALNQTEGQTKSTL